MNDNYLVWAPIELLVDAYTTMDDDDNVIPDLLKVSGPFFTTKSGMHGHVGLGLHVAYNHVVQRLKGGIIICSEWRQGMTVTIRINSQT